jgi:membrane protein
MATTSAGKKRSVQQIKSKVLDSIWDIDSSEFTRFKRALHSSIKVCLMAGHGFIESLVKLQAMALAFKTLIAVAPLLAVVFSILKAFGVHNRMEPALAEALAPLGENGREITSHLIGFVDRMSATALGAIGLVTLFLTVLSLMGTIEEAFNYIWRVKAPRRLTRKFSDYLSVILIGPVLVFAAVTITATLQSNAFVKTLISIEPFGTVMLGLLRLVPYITVWGAFTFMYVFIPNTRVKLQSAIIGGLVGAILWATVGWGFAVFVASSTRYYVIYSSFAILLLFLLWLHIGWVIVLLGAQVAYAHQHLRFYEGERELMAQSAAGREKLALLMMCHIARNFYHGLPPLSVTELAAKLHLPAILVNEFMDTFQEKKILLALADEQSFVLSRDPELISVKEILDCVRGSAERRKSRAGRDRDEDEIDELLRDVDRSVADSLEGKSLQRLILSRTPKN